MLTIFGRPGRFCDGVSRRSFLRIGALGIAAGGLTLADIFRAEARAEGPQQGGALRLVAASLVLGSAFHAVLLPQDFSGGTRQPRGPRRADPSTPPVRMV